MITGKVIYSSKGLVIINKPAGVESVNISPLICHRLDKDTSGLLIIAKNQKTKEQVQDQFRARTVKKRYRCLAIGKFREKKLVEGWLERDPKDRKLMKISTNFVKSGDSLAKVETSTGKNRRFSKTKFYPNKIFYKKMFKGNKDQFNYFSLIEAQIFTGRKHQIRVHLKYLNQPILGDPWYGSKISKEVSQKLGVDRLMLQAYKLSFVDPTDDKKVELELPMAKGFKKIISQAQEVDE